MKAEVYFGYSEETLRKADSAFAFVDFHRFDVSRSEHCETDRRDSGSPSSDSDA